MKPLFPDPYPFRFRSYEDASNFLKTGDRLLCIPTHIIVRALSGRKKSIPNPEYFYAPFELAVILLARPSVDKK